MKRVCFTLQIKESRVAEYLAAHQVWPEMLEAMASAGIRNYSMFMRPDGLAVGVFEAEDPVAALRQVGQTDVSRRWQASMAGFFGGGSGDPQAEGLQWLEQYFHLS